MTQLGRDGSWHCCVIRCLLFTVSYVVAIDTWVYKLGYTHNICHAGCADKSISIWSTRTGQKVHVLTGHAGTPTTIQWHPRRMLVASACNALAFWTPDPKKLAPPSYIYPMQ